METKQALGMIETKGLVGSVEAADAMVRILQRLPKLVFLPNDLCDMKCL